MNDPRPSPQCPAAVDAAATALQVRAFAWYLVVVLVGVALLWAVAERFDPSSSTVLGVLLPVILGFNVLGLGLLWRCPALLRALQVAQYASYYPFLLGFMILLIAQADGPDAVRSVIAAFALWIPVLIGFTFYAFGSRDGLHASLAFVAGTIASISVAAARGAALDGPGVAYALTVVVASLAYAAIVYGTSQVADRLTAARFEAALAAELALRDALTGVHSRFALEERFEQELARARRDGRPLAVYFLDLDGFKAINDAHGHAIGDALLRAFALRVQSVVRASDTVGRLGGDEFVVLASVADEVEAHALAERLVAVCTEPVDVDGKDYELSVSVGVAAYPADGVDREALLRAADAAMYAAKRSGRRGWSGHTRSEPAAARDSVLAGGPVRFDGARFDARRGMPA